MAGTLNHIGIERPLRQKLNGTVFFRQPLRLSLKDPNKLGANDLALLLWIDHAGEPIQEAGAGIHHHQRNMHMLAERRHHLLTLARPQQAGIDKDTSQLRADRLMHQQGGDR